MRFSEVRWGRAVGGALACEIVLVPAAVAWVTIYSYLIHPGEQLPFYERYAQVASPWVSLLLGGPVFYAVCRWLARTRPTAIALFAAYLLIEAPIMLSTPNPSVTPWFLALNYGIKLLGCILAI
jgi:hypothetical protein